MSEFLRRTVLARLAEVGVPLQPNDGEASRRKVEEASSTA